MSSAMHVVSRDSNKYIKVHISESHNHNKILVLMFFNSDFIKAFWAMTNVIAMYVISSKWYKILASV